MYYMTNLMKIDEDNYEITSVYGEHNVPYETEIEINKNGFFVESIPQPTPKFGHYSILCVNKSTMEVYYKNVERPLTDTEKIKVLETENANINYALMMGGII